jgi:hypothetical protein
MKLKWKIFIGLLILFCLIYYFKIDINSFDFSKNKTPDENYKIYQVSKKNIQQNCNDVCFGQCTQNGEKAVNSTNTSSEFVCKCYCGKT